MAKIKKPLIYGSGFHQHIYGTVKTVISNCYISPYSNHHTLVSDFHIFLAIFAQKGLSASRMADQG